SDVVTNGKPYDHKIGLLTNGALTNYVGSMRSCSCAIASTMTYMTTPTTNQAGIFYFNSKTRIRDITDGASNTIMTGERSWTLMQIPTPVWAGTWAGAVRSDDECRTARASMFAPAQGINAGSRTNQILSSWHTGGVHVGL